ncbi:hypothetical protein METHP14_110066 [Pseudomonas sp. P14-2025]
MLDMGRPRPDRKNIPAMTKPGSVAYRNCPASFIHATIVNNSY